MIICVLFAGLLVFSSSVMAEEAPLIEEEMTEAVDLTEIETESKPEITAPTGEVKVAAFTLSVENRTPVGDLSLVENSINKVLFFTDLRGFKGQIIRHVWYFQDKEMANVEYSVKGPRWRVWSSKSLLPNWLGSWTVKVIDPNGFIVHEQSFDYVAASENVTEPASESVEESGAVEE